MAKKKKRHRRASIHYLNLNHPIAVHGDEVFPAPHDEPDMSKGYKKLKRKLGKKVLAGKITLDEARSRLGREIVQKSARPTWTPDPQHPPTDGELEYARVKARVRQQQAELTKSFKRKPPAGPSQRDLVTKAAAEARLASSYFDNPPAVTKQLTSTESAIIAAMEAQFEAVGHEVLQPSLRRGEARMLITTPKRMRLLRQILRKAEDPANHIHITRPSSDEKPHFSKVRLAELKANYAGTRLYKAGDRRRI